MLFLMGLRGAGFQNTSFTNCLQLDKHVWVVYVCVYIIYMCVYIWKIYMCMQYIVKLICNKGSFDEYVLISSHFVCKGFFTFFIFL